MDNHTSNREMTVLVTGGSGFLGGHAIAGLLEKGYKVRTTVRNLKREPEVRTAISHVADTPDALDFFTADLDDDAGWTEAAEGCDYILHSASPFPKAQPKDPQDLIVPAREGALRVVKAGLATGVKRIIMTSSVAAVRGDGGPSRDTPYTEEDWTDVNAPGLTPYAQSKTIAEQSVWDLVDESGDSDRVAMVNPSLILGPVLGNEDSTSLQVIGRMLKGMPAGLPEAVKKAPTRVLPKPLVRVLALFDPGIRTFLPDIGKRALLSAEKAENKLGWKARPVEETIVDCGRSLAARNG